MLKLAEAAGLRMPQRPQNVLAPADVRALATLAGFEPVKSEQRVLVPMRLFGLGRVINRFLAPFPVIDGVSLRPYAVCRSLQHLDDGIQSATVRRSDYIRLKAGRAYFGDFDPFGDFDLVFGAAKLSLKVVEIPIRYANRTYGETQISRFRHGLMLIRMVLFAFLRIKAL